jgi:hypothetical protein
MTTRRPVSIAAALVLALACAAVPAAAQAPRTFPTPEDAVKALAAAVKLKDTKQLLAIFGADGPDLVDTSAGPDARQNRQVFAVAFRERWRLEDHPPAGKTLVVGKEDWPFPVPLVKGAGGWHFDTAAGKAEVIARRIGRNELAAIRICRTYVAAQQLYARDGHDGVPAGVYATRFASDPGRQNGLYWPAAKGAKRSPLGDLLAEAATDGRATPGAKRPSPFHGYYFAILTAQGAAAPGGAKSYVTDGRMSGGFALVAWPAEYGASGIMSFIVGADGVVRERDLGPGTKATPPVKTYDPGASWAVVP